MDSRYRRHVDDGTAAGRGHDRNRMLTTQKHTVTIHGVDQTPRLQRGVDNITQGNNTRTRPDA